MKFTILDNTKTINIEVEVKKIKKNNPDLIYEEFNKQNNFELVFLYGGDGTYLKFIKEYLDKDIKIILMNYGKLSFLNSLYKYEKLDLTLFNKINYLEYLDDNIQIPFINECEIFCNKINEFDFYIDNIMFKTILSSRFFCFSSIGSTGLARSRNYSLIINNDSYIFHILDEPKYNYYNSIAQPLLLNKNQFIRLETKNEVEYCLKIDNNTLKTETKKIKIYNKKTSCLIYNAYNLLTLSKKIKELF